MIDNTVEVTIEIDEIEVVLDDLKFLPPPDGGYDEGYSKGLAEGYENGKNEICDMLLGGEW